MAEPFVQVAPDGGGKLIDAQALADPASGNTVYRQTVTIGDPEDLGAVADVGQDGGLFTRDLGIGEAKTQDSPIFAAITGDPNGDFAGVNLIEQVMDDASGLNLNVAIKSGIPLGADGGLRLSDGVLLTFTLPASSSSSRIIDCAGYASVMAQSSGAVTLGWSNDGVTFSANAVIITAAGVVATSMAAATVYIIPRMGRYLRITGSAAALVTVALSQSVASFAHSNIASVAGTAAVTAGVAGMLAIGGNVAVGSAPTANPIPLAWDGTNTRRILTDATSGGVVLGSSTQNNGQTIGILRATNTSANSGTIKNSAGRLTALTITQGGTVAGFFHLYNANSVTLGTTTDVWVFAVPGAVGTWTIDLPDGGLYFSSGIGASFTAGFAAGDNTTFGSAPSLAANYAFI